MEEKEKKKGRRGSNNGGNVGLSWGFSPFS